jgi:hypothetical protein
MALMRGGVAVPVFGPVLTNTDPVTTTTERKSTMQRDPVITVSLSTDMAWAYAQFLKRVGLDDYRSLAVDIEEAYQMRAAGQAIREELARAGYAPR